MFIPVGTEIYGVFGKEEAIKLINEMGSKIDEKRATSSLFQRLSITIEFFSETLHQFQELC